MKNRIKELRKRNNMTLLQVAKAIGVAESTVQRYETGAIENLKYDTMVALAKLYRVSPAYLMGWDSGVVSAPVFEAAAGEGRITDGFPTEAIPALPPAGTVAVKVVGRSMEPELQDGDIVFVRPQNAVDDSRQIALVKINGDEATLKRVDVKENGIILYGDNVEVYPPHFYTADEVKQLPVRIEGVVVQLLRHLK